MQALATIAPLEEAMKHFGAKSAVASTLSSAQWADVPLALRENALFSSQVENARVLATVQAKLRDALALRREEVKGGQAFVSRDSFIGDLRALVLGTDRKGLPVSENPFADRGLSSVASPARLGMIFDLQTRSAQGFAGWKMDQDPDVLDAFPAQELLPSTAKNPRTDWAARWAAAGGPEARGRLVALKTDPVWARISRFQTPWPPYDFGSTRELRDVSRAEAEELGLLKPGQTVQPTQQQDFNRNLAASVADLPADLLAGLKANFGDQVVIKNGQARWQGDLIGQLFDGVSSALDSGAKFDTKAFKGRSIDFGVAPPAAVRKAAGAADLSTARMQLRPDNIAHLLSGHGAGSETRKDQRPVTREDVKLLPFVWRDPDAVRPGDKPRSLVFEKNLAGKTVMVGWDMYGQNNWQPQTMWIKEAGR